MIFELAEVDFIVLVYPLIVIVILKTVTQGLKDHRKWTVIVPKGNIT